MLYTVKPNDTFQSIATAYATTVFELARLNNITGKVPARPTTLTIYIPVIANGNQDVTTYWAGLSNITGLSSESMIQNSLALGTKNNQGVSSSAVQLKNPTDQITYNKQDLGNQTIKLIGNSDQISHRARYDVIGKLIENVDCWILMKSSSYSKKIYMPCYPEDPSDSTDVSYNPISVLGRSEPIQIYNGTGPRTSSFNFHMHREMTGNEAYIDDLVSKLYSAVYPSYDSEVSATEVTVHAGNSIQITGIMQSPQIKYSGPFIDNRYNIIDLSFSVTEVTGGAPTNASVRNSGTYR